MNGDSRSSLSTSHLSLGSLSVSLLLPAVDIQRAFSSNIMYIIDAPRSLVPPLLVFARSSQSMHCVMLLKVSEPIPCGQKQDEDNGRSASTVAQS